MRRILVAASLLLAVLGPVAAEAPTHSLDSDKGCNVRLKGLKTLSDPQGKLVNLHPKNTTAAAIGRATNPRRGSALPSGIRPPPQSSDALFASGAPAAGRTCRDVEVTQTAIITSSS